jgi:hypothetical protein
MKCWCGCRADRLFTTRKGPMCWLCESCFAYWTMVADLEAYVYGKG